MKVLVFQADHREPLEKFDCEWLLHPFLRKDDKFRVINCLKETPRIALPRYDFYVITGSRFQAGEDLPWIHYLLRQVNRILKSEKPLLGICFGHQLLGRALGAEVIENSKGVEVGTVKMELTKAGKQDPLFAKVPKRFKAFQYHYFDVKGISKIKGAELLASNEHTRVQAFRYKNAWGVQFHPETDLTRARKAIKYRQEMSYDRSLDYDTIYKKLEKVPAGHQIMRNFYQIATQSWFEENLLKILELPVLTAKQGKRLIEGVIKKVF